MDPEADIAGEEEACRYRQWHERDDVQKWLYGLYLVCSVLYGFVDAL